MKKLNIAARASMPTKNKTGSWRTFRPIITDKCTGCRKCLAVCPEDVIKIVNKKARIDYNYCKGCLICMTICPVKAVISKRENYE